VGTGVARRISSSRLVALVLGRHIVAPQLLAAAAQHYPAHALISRSRPLCVEDPCVPAPDADVARVLRLLSAQKTVIGASGVAMTVVPDDLDERTFSFLKRIIDRAKSGLVSSMDGMCTGTRR
jgi:hypothetical protein